LNFSRDFLAAGHDGAEPRPETAGQH